VALANPKTMLFYLALLPAIIDTSNVATHEFAIVALVITVVYGGVLIAYALAAAAARHRFDSPRQMQRIRRVSSVIIAMSALLIVIR
jgi:threonine/homoserine/homoserine lactone efflux protein